MDKDASVNWQVNGVKGDNLHKIGEGTLVVQGTGVNEGGLKVGDGTVVSISRLTVQDTFRHSVA